jgi:hypothetical protein
MILIQAFDDLAPSAPFLSGFIPGGTMKRLLFLVVVACLTCRQGHSKAVYQYETKAAVATADEAFVDAVTTQNRQSLTKLLDSDFSWTSTNGEVIRENDLLANIPKNSGIGKEGREFRVFSDDVVGVLTQSGQFHTLRIWVKRQAGWRILAYHAVNQLSAPPAAHPGQSGCDNPCKSLPYIPKNATESAVIASWQALESDVTAHDSAAWATHVSDDFIQVSFNSDEALDKAARMKIIDAQKASGAGAAPPPLASARFDDLGAVAVMHALNHPLAGKPILVTRVWIKRSDSWVMSVSFQTTVQGEAGPAH